MTKQYKVDVLSKEKFFNSYQEVKKYLCSLPNHYCYVKIVVIENDKKLLCMNSLVSELFELLEC